MVDADTVFYTWYVKFNGKLSHKYQSFNGNTVITAFIILSDILAVCYATAVSGSYF